MCTPSPHFKLCTCSEAPVRSNYWKLTRGNQEVHLDVVGKFLPPPDIDEAVHFDAAYFVIERLEFDLNNSDVFDFEYNPNEGDMIEFHFMELDDPEGLRATFVYSEGKFQTEGTGVFYEGGKPLASGDIKYVPKPSNKG
tara:strand:+ start:79 stop:495 length:417 start_codon:yes stop_codon:yes gene_type:complete